ncbi:phage holin [Frisingicoccus sp.]|mgnify:CR=1 FL=1|uniref:phage holin n=1 Tax=Frisingicoccus sp. TaxID=1918627 RepID=UPI003AB1C91A
MNKISVGTISRTVVLFAALLNQFLTISGKNPLPFSEDDIYNGITMCLTTAAALWAWWKNNSFTKAAIAGDACKENYRLQNTHKEDAS